MALRCTGKARRDARRGASIISMVIALNVLGSFIAFGVPPLRDALTRASVSAGADALVGALRTARMEALRRNAPVTICKSAWPEQPGAGCADSSAEWPDGWVVFVDEGVVGAIDGTDRVISTGRVGGPIDSVSEQPTRIAAITFHPVGPVAGPAGTHEVRLASALSHGTFSRVICVSLLGRTSSMSAGNCPA